ncbi:RICIN domain-containing protein [Nonomuraea sp. NBC_00507]|uniref:LamG-like jellyroll fold domain-containing protein n=1 Tax=Nonomuraea sp. NBC_00507 TaxID=2976002 RepID=UPI002E1797E7
MWDSSETQPQASAAEDAPEKAGSGGRSTARTAGDHARQAGVKTQFTEGRLVLEPDAGLLAGAETRFPLYIDPMYGTGATRWAYATNTNVNRNDEFLRVGREPEGDNYLARSFFEFPLGPLAGSRILSANFSITLTHSSSCGATPTRLWWSDSIASTPRTAWSPALIQHLDTQSASANKSSCPQPDVTMSFGGGLAGSLQANSGAGAYTVALTAQDECNCDAARAQWKKFYGSTARLIVDYNHAPVTPSAADMSLGPAGADPVVCGPGIRVNASNGIRLRAKLSDSDGGNVRAQWTVNGIPAQYAPPDSAMAASGSEFTTDLPAAALPEGSYSWTVRANDDTDAGSPGPTCAFVVDNTLPGAPKATTTELALTTGLIVPAPPASAVVGQAAAVTLTPTAQDTDVAGYLIGLGVGAARAPSLWVPAAPDAKAVAPVVPIASGSTINYLTIRARDLTGQLGATITYKFKANAGTVTHVRGDASGDGKPDYTVMADAGGGKSALWRWTTKTSGSGLFEPIAPQDSPGSYPTSTTTTVTGDFDGDGRSDVAVFQPKTTAGAALTVQRSDGDTLLGSPELWSDAGWNLASMKIVAGNFDGDAQGRDDIAVLYDQGGSTVQLRVLVATGSPGAVAFAPPAVWFQSGTGAMDWSKIKIVAGDFTRDGKADIAEIKDLGGRVGIFLHPSSGSAFPSSQVWYDEPGRGWDWNSSKFVTGDVTGDGRPDIATLYGFGRVQTALYVFANKADGTGFVPPPLAWASLEFAWDSTLAEPFTGDVDGDGDEDITVVYRCCGTGQRVLWRFTSNQGTVSAPTLVARTSLNSGGKWPLRMDPSAAYKLVARHSGLCLDISSNSIANGAVVWQWGCHSYSNQAFRFVPNGAAHYMLQPAHTSGMCLSASGSTQDGVDSYQWQCLGPNGDQVYKAEYVSGTGDDTVIRLRPVHSDKCLDIEGVRTDASAPVQQWTCYGGANQDFYLKRTAVTPYNLMGSYAMNESGGGTLADDSGRNATATLTGGATVGSGSGTFNGTSAYAATSGPAVDTSQSFTVSAWVRLTSDAHYVTAVSQDGTSVGGFNFGYQPPGDGNVWALELRNQDGYVAGAKSRASAPATLNTWTHLVGVRDVGANQIRLYVNGQLAGTAAYTYRWNATGPLTIARTLWQGTPADFWPGQIDDVRIWNRVLDANEISTLYATRS